MAWVAVAIGGSAIIGGVTSMLGSEAQAGAAEDASRLQHEQYLQTREDYEPWRTAGGNAIKQQANLMGLNGEPAQTNAFATFREDPGYDWQVGQTVQAVDRSAAARGLLNSGATIKAIQDRAGHLADQQYGNWYNRLAGISGTGQTATAGTASAGSSAAANAGNAMIQAGNARASGYGGAASSVNQGLNNYFAYNGIAGQGANSLSNLTQQGIANNPYLF